MPTPPIQSDDDDDDDDDEPWLKGPLVSTKDGDDDDTYAELLPGEVDVEGPSPFFDWLRKTAGVEGAKIRVDGELAHIHVAGTVVDEPEPDEFVYDIVTVAAKPPMVATIGAPTFHGPALGPGTGSPDVYAEGQPVFRMLRDAVICTACTPGPHLGGVVVPLGPVPTVFVNGFPIARAGDAVMEVLGGANPISLGATTVYAGEPAPPMKSVDPRPKPKPKGWWKRKLDRLDELVEVEAGAELDVAVVPTEGAIDVGAEVDVDGLGVGGNVHGEGEGALLRAGGGVHMRITIDGEPHDIFDAHFEQDIGAWKGWFDVIVDPVRRRPHHDGDLDFELFGDGEQDE